MFVNLTPVVLDLELYAGDQTAVIIRAIDKTTKQPADLSDRTWTSQWRRKRSSTTAIDLAVDDSSSASGEIIVHFPGTLDPLGVWDLQGTHAVSGKDTIITGDVSVDLDVTRP